LLSGLPATRVSYGDKGADEYVFIHGDGVFIVETSDQTLATAIVKTMASEAQPSSAPASEAQPSSAPASEAQPSSAPAS
jgi:hypothetical protein